MDKEIEQKLLSGSLWVVGSKIVALPSSILLTAFLTRLLSPDEMGVYFLIFSLVSFSTMLSALGMGRAIVRIVSESLAVDAFGRAREAIKYVLQFGLLSSAIVAILLISGLGQMLSERIFHSSLMNNLIYYTAIWMGLFTIQRLIAEALRGLHDIRFATIFNGLIPNIIGVVVLGIVLWHYKKSDIATTLTIIIVCYALNVILALFYLVRTTNKLNRISKWAISRGDIIRTSWPLYFSALLMSGLQHGHLWLLGYYSTKESVAIFGAVFRILVLITATLEMVRLVIPPLICQLYTQGKYAKIEKILRSTATIAGLPSIVALILIFLFGKNVLHSLYGSSYILGYKALMVMSVAHLINILTGTPGVLLVMGSKEKLLLVSSIISGSIGILLSMLLIGSMDYVGVAVGAGAGIILQNLLMAGYCQKKMSINTFFSVQETFNLTKRFMSIVVSLKNRAILVISTSFRF
jgi:O-antigen/teichoic acid export membrane protein